MNRTAKLKNIWMRLVGNGRLQQTLGTYLTGCFLALGILVATQGIAAADTLTIRPDATVLSGVWTGANAGNLGDASDLSAATINGQISTFTVRLQNNSSYTGATINSVNVQVRAWSDGSGQAEQIDFGPTGAISGFPVNVARTAGPVPADYSYIPAGPFTDLDIDNLEIDVAITQVQTGETVSVYEVWVVIDYTPSAAPNQVVDCNDCHTEPPTEAVSRNNSGIGEVVGSHATHNAYACTICHPNNVLLDHRASLANPEGQIDMKGSIQGGTYSKGSAFIQNNDINGAGLGFCSNVTCHAGTDTPQWGNNGTLTCDSCHDSPPVTNAHARHFTAKNWSNPDLSGASCVPCHRDNTAGGGGHSDVTDGVIVVEASLTPSGASPAISCGTAPALGCHNGEATPVWNTSGITCLQCHTVGDVTNTNPISGLHDELPTVSNVQHDESINAAGCQTCHREAGGKPSATHVNGTADTPVDFASAVVTVGYSAGAPATCTASCHSEAVNASEAWARKWHENSDQATGAECAGCHGDWNTGWNAGVAHRTDAQPEATHGTGSYKCKDCHALEAVSGYTWAGQHANNSITINNEGTTGFARGTGGNTGKSGCTNSCHADGFDGVGAGLHSFTTTGWNLETVSGDSIDAGCDSCHGGGGEYWPSASAYPNRAGRHATHMTQLAAKLGIVLAGATDAEQKQMCDYCHNDASGAGGATHKTDSGDSIADVGAFNHIGDAAADGSATWTSGDQTCAVACHNTKTTGAGTYGWRDAGTSTCTMCHTIGGGGTVDPNSGLHAISPTVSAQQHDDGLTACTTCHDSLPAMSTISTHVNNNATNTQPRGLFAAYTDGSPGSCFGGVTGNAGCHDGAGEAGSWARKWDSTISGASDGSTECQGCHGGFSNDWTYSGALAGNVDHQRDWDSASSSSDGAEVMANHDGTDKCKTCHVFPDGPYNSSWGGANHGNDKIDMNSTMGYSSTNFNCTTNCHSEAWGNTDHNLEDSGWTVNTLAGPGLDCRGCHGGASPAAGVSANSPHADNTAAGGGVYTCEGCHTGHNAGYVSIPENLNVGIDYPAADHADAIALGGSQTSGTSEAAICWNCHAANGISEWGLNTDTNGSEANYDFGTLNQTSWVGATWNSAQGQTSSDSFWYKRGTIQSTHAANNSNGVSGVDSVGDIRCSYCHDVHDTRAGSPNGAPYLRGTWMGNPYKEDGAPQSGMTYGQYEWGSVPRGSVSNTEYGGYFIDQNSGNPTSTWSADGSSSLCEMCHGNNNGTWSATEINSLNQFGTASNDWVGNNGHANAVLGGDGTGRSNIFRTSDRAPNGVDTNGAKPDMGYANHGAGVGYGFRGTDGRSFTLTPAMDASQAAMSSRPYGGNYYEWGATVDEGTPDLQYHKFSCSKCHNPHASRLPRLMITNCLDTKHNSWDQNAGNGGVTSSASPNDNSITLGSGTSPDSWNRTWSNVTSAQNCHRVAGSDNASPAGYGTGWNTVTPW